LAIDMEADAILSGSETILAREEPIPDETPEDLAHEIDPKDDRPLFVVLDSRGRIKIWHWLRRQPYWKDVVVLVSNSTPEKYKKYLEGLGVSYITTGEDRVSIRDALEELNCRFGVEKVRIDSGGTLNGVLLRQGLVDEISVLIHPCLVGGFSPNSLFKAPDVLSRDKVIPIRLKGVESMKGDLVWINYEVVRD
jgi:2,5-diamino-6-(ribosylamino)-4(3H)-pyrimidinone 5'-phosphate reductase